jgi:tRNA A-37 threonylcarbamoyl transferase component Bud32
MTSERYQRAYELFLEALVLHDERRAAFLEDRCRDDPQLKGEVQSLLAADEAAGNDADDPESIRRRSLARRDGIPDRIGPYRIRSEIASGGMGTVYLAIQEHPRRSVALKVMKRGIVAKSALRRFEFESQILARLQHPGIAQVFEAGAYDDGIDAVPYFAMEYIANAKSITDYANDKKLGTRERLELFVKACEAVSHGHDKGIIHRDLKPDNILIDARGQPKIIDFGVARATDSDMAVTTFQTDVGQLLGTLQYMSPEQCDADPHDLDSRSDVYTLGVVLYELLCGRLPYEVTRAAIHEATRMIRQEAPPRPSTIDRALRGDVESIVLKALDKDRDRRYRSAADLAGDVNRFLNKEPIIARPPSVLYQLKMFSRRHRAAFGGIMATAVTLVVATIVSVAFGIDAHLSRKSAWRQWLNAQTHAALLARHSGELDVAGKMLQEVLDEYTLHGDGRYEWRTVQAMVFLANVRELQNELAHAEDLYRGAVERGLAGLGNDDWLVLDAMGQLASVLARQGKVAEAQESYARVVGTAHMAHGGRDRRTALLRADYGAFLLKQGRHEEAEEELTAAYTVLGSEGGEGRDDVLRWLVRLYEDWGQPEKASEWRAKLPATQNATASD